MSRLITPTITKRDREMNAARYNGMPIVGTMGYMSVARAIAIAHPSQAVRIELGKAIATKVGK